MKSISITKLFLAASVLGLWLVPVAAGAEVSKTLKDRLFARYDQQNLNVVHEKILVTALPENGDYWINYDHFHESISKKAWPPKYLSLNLLDAQTTEKIDANARFSTALEPGEMIRVKKFYILSNKEGILFIDIYFAALDGKRIMRTQTVYNDGGVGLVYKVDFGSHFRFCIPPAMAGTSEDDYIKEINRVIGLYMLPTDEYLTAKKAAAEATEAKKNVTIQPGMSKEEVMQILGEPLKTVTFGEKMFLKYADLTIELRGDKVIEVSPK